MKVVSKQKNSRSCFICGMFNPIGLRAEFYNMEDNSVMTLFKYKFEHQSFPQRVHGGLIGTMLDELAMRAYWTQDENMFGVTTSMETKFRKPVPYDVELVGKGIIVSDTSRFFKAQTQILDRDGNVVQENEPVAVKQVFSKETADKVLDMMESVVSEGTGRNGKVKGYYVAGKTSTAEQGRGENKTYTASFIALAPATDPQVAIMVTITRLAIILLMME